MSNGYIFNSGLFLARGKPTTANITLVEGAGNKKYRETAHDGNNTV